MIQTKDLKPIDDNTTFGQIYEYCHKSKQDCLNCLYRTVCLYWQNFGMPAPYQYPEKDKIAKLTIPKVDKLAKQLRNL